MKHESYELRNQILGTLIGLVKACESNPPTENTTGIILEGLQAAHRLETMALNVYQREIASGETAEIPGDMESAGSMENSEGLKIPQEMLKMPERIREEKFTIVPNCRVCASPCGNTSDFDMEELDWRSLEKQRANRRLLEKLYEIAEAATAETEATAGTEAIAGTEATSGTGAAANEEVLNEEDVFRLYQGLAVLSFDWEPEEIEELLG